MATTIRSAALSTGAIMWLANGERGLSSETIFTHLTGVVALDDDWLPARYHPLDPADLRRCRLLLDACPELVERMHVMAGVSKQWTTLVEHWPELCALMDEELPEWRTPPPKSHMKRTYHRMKELGL